jgi:ABC-type transport system involved in multi-copper enzyme maturation permease subunit
VRWVAVVFQLGIVAILAPAISSGSITDEVTSRTFLMLRMTPLSALTVVLGKLKAAFLYVSIFLVSSLPVLLALIFLEPSTTADQAKPQGTLIWLATVWDTGGWRVTACLAIMLVTTITFIAAGFCASAWSKTTSTATAISYGFAGIITIVTLAAMIPGAFSQPVTEAMLTLNPMVAALRVTSDELFGNLSPQVWVHNLVLMGSLAVGLIVLSAARVYYIFTRHL